MSHLLRDHLATIVAEELSSIPPGVFDISADRRPSQRRSSFSWFSANAALLEPMHVEQSERARATRDIERVAAWFPWGLGVVARWLDGERATSLDGLTDESCHSLRERMLALEDNVQNCCDSDEEPPAR